MGRKSRMKRAERRSGERHWPHTEALQMCNHCHLSRADHGVHEKCLFAPGFHFMHEKATEVRYAEINHLYGWGTGTGRLHTQITLDEIATVDISADPLNRQEMYVVEELLGKQLVTLPLTCQHCKLGLDDHIEDQSCLFSFGTKFAPGRCLRTAA